MGELEGKVAIVTGGAAGIGEATVEVFVEEGAKVVIADVNPSGEELAERLGESAAFKLTDVSDSDQVQALVDFAVERFGGLHVMCNNAGIPAAFRRFLKDDLRDFERVMGVNLYGVMVGSQRAALHMVDHGGGSIINTTSISALAAGTGLTNYRAAKAAVIHFSRCIALDLAEHGIRVNCVAPGNIATSIDRPVDTSVVIGTLQPLPHVGTSRDLAYASLYLASDRSAHVTGIVIPVDGGTSTGASPGFTQRMLAAGASTPG